MADHRVTTAATVRRGHLESWVLDLYDSSGELVESVPLDWDGTGGFLSVGLDHVAPALRQRGLVYGGAAWNEQGGAWHAVVHDQGWPGKRF